MVHRLPRWQIMREQSPSATTAQGVEHGIEDLAYRVELGPASRFRHRQMRGQLAPFGVRDISWIQLSVHSPRSVSTTGGNDQFSDSLYHQ
jgi:hypothetical protein